MRRKSLAQNIAAEAEHTIYTRQVINEKQGSYDFMRWVCNWIELSQTITNDDSNNKRLIQTANDWFESTTVAVDEVCVVC